MRILPADPIIPEEEAEAEIMWKSHDRLELQPEREKIAGKKLIM